MKIKFFFIFCFILCLGSRTAAQTAFPSLEAAPEAYEYGKRAAADPRPGNYWRNLAEAALWASSVNAGAGAEAKAAAYMDRIAAAAAELAADSALPRDPRERGEHVLTFLHRRFLKSYSEYQTRVDEIFVSGRYNCVSSAVLYMILGFSVGLDVEGVMTRDHAFASAAAGDERIDVETTNPYGFDPGNRKEFLDGFGRATGFAYVPAKNYRDRAVINPAELVSLILSNRIAVLERGNRFAEAVPLGINRAVFLGVDISGEKNETAGADPGRAGFFEDPRRDMMNRLFNLGAYLIKTGKEDDVLAWTEYARKQFPDPERWQEFTKNAVNNKLVKLIRAQKAPAARTALESLKERLNSEHYAAMDSMVLEAEAAERVNGIKSPGEVEETLAFLARVWERLPEQRRNEMRTAALLKEAERLGKARDWTGGMRWINGSMERYGREPRLESVLRSFRQNRIGELHNEFVSFYNRKDYAGAKASAERSLMEFPGERQLLQDLGLAEKAQQR
ncbi:MAG: hypothetical protein LBD31_10225 [Treponema sp.]|jgi:hypothetical protein|nr:hypothetical protein [Treponema sp.]